PALRRPGVVHCLQQVMGVLNATPAPAPGTPGVLECIPGMLRGPAHGDLHGRNVLVGAVRDRVMWPTVFDYEHMSNCNLVGWDFVKLETELKTRAYDRIYPPAEEQLVHAVHAFALDLAERTENYHRDQDWPVASDGTNPPDRLRALLLQIRQLAAVHLGDNRGRPHRWLEEYYFLLSCYGVVTGRFENVTARQLLG